MNPLPISGENNFYELTVETEYKLFTGSKEYVVRADFPLHVVAGDVPAVDRDRVVVGANMLLQVVYDYPPIAKDSEEKGKVEIKVADLKSIRICLNEADGEVDCTKVAELTNQLALVNPGCICSLEARQQNLAVSVCWAKGSNRIWHLLLL